MITFRVEAPRVDECGWRSDDTRQRLPRSHWNGMAFWAGDRWCFLTSDTWTEETKEATSVGGEEFYRLKSMTVTLGDEVTLREALRLCRGEDAEHLMRAAGFTFDFEQLRGVSITAGFLIGFVLWAVLIASGG